MGVDPVTLATNMAIILGGLILLIFGGFAVYALWTSLNIVYWMLQRRRADRAYKAVAFRPDGKPYPPHIEGVCTACGRGNKRIYFAGSEHELCPDCYDAFWREEERLTSP